MELRLGVVLRRTVLGRRVLIQLSLEFFKKGERDKQEWREGEGQAGK